jgi:hypothetical protein
MRKPPEDLFVDRSSQSSAFSKMLDGRTHRRIMALTGGQGMGKSWLLHIFAHETRRRQYPLVYIDFADRQPYDTLRLVRRCRDAFDPEHFNILTETINRFTMPQIGLNVGDARTPPNINIGIGSENVLTNSSINVSNVGNTIIKDNFFIVRADDPIARQAIEDRINAAFFECLTVLCRQTKVVFLFDTYERNSLKADRWMPRSADRWICAELLARIRDGKLKSAIAVLAGRHMPEFGAEWNHILGHMSLDLFDRNAVKEYLSERLGLSMITDAEVERLCQVGATTPHTLGLFGDRLVQAIKPTAQNDEW